MSKLTYSSACLPTIEIIATSRAKEKAAKKLKIPYSYGNEIQTYEALPIKECHVHVDLSQVSGYEKHQYYKLMKKYYLKEINNLLQPNRKLLGGIFLSLVLISSGLLIYCTPKKENTNPSSLQTIQKASKNNKLDNKNHVRE